MSGNNDSLMKSTTSVTMPWEESITVSKTIVIDSRQRNCAKFKTPSYYKIDLGDIFKNVNEVELKGAIIPKTSYNIHSSNNKIDFALGDYLTGFKILNGGAGYTSAPTVTIGAPPGIGIQATATAFINSRGTITNIAIGTSGSGYIPSRPPYVFIEMPTNKKQAVQPNIIAIIGNHYTADLRVGEYEIGGNPIPPSTTPSKLLLEIQNAMNYQINGGNYNTSSTGPFTVRLVSQYPEIGAIPGTPEAAGTNACLFNRIQVTNVNSDIWEFMWYSGESRSESAATILGFNTVDSGVGVFTPVVNSLSGELIPAGTSIRGVYDYNLLNDPDYVVLTIGTGERNLDRIRSLDDGMDHRFCTLLFDNNNPDTLHDLTGNTENIGGIDQLIGPTGRGTFYRAAGGPKPMKAGDFDGSKKFSFKPPIAKLSTLTIAFTKYGYKAGSNPRYYNMEGREHLLLFEFTSSDNKSRMTE